MSALGGAEDIAAGRYLYGKLSPITGIGGQVYPGAGSREAVMPYIIYQYFPRPGGGDTEALGGTRVLARLRFLVKVISATMTAAEPILKAMDSALNATSGQQSGYTIQNVRRIEPFQLPVQEGDETYWQTGAYYDLDVCAGV